MRPRAPRYHWQNRCRSTSRKRSFPVPGGNLLLWCKIGWEVPFASSSFQEKGRIREPEDSRNGSGFGVGCCSGTLKFIADRRLIPDHPAIMTGLKNIGIACIDYRFAAVIINDFHFP